MSPSKKYLQTKKIIGNWQSKRLILDKFNKSKALYFGKMSIVIDEKVCSESVQGLKHEFITLNLTEEGNLTIQGKTYEFFQEYLLHLFNDRCDVSFKNKKPFFSINRQAESQNIEHLCQLDRYVGQISFINEVSFLLSFHVEGPKKEYYLKALYKRSRG